MKNLFLLLLLCLACFAATPAQIPSSIPSSPPQRPTDLTVSEGDVLKVDTRLVRVPFTVINRKGLPITKLTQEHFRIFEDSVEQTIAAFEPIEEPLTAALLLDTSPSTRFRLEDIKQAAITFVNRLRAGDRLIIFSFSDKVLPLTEITGDREAVRSAIRNATEGKTTRLYDAISFANERLAKIAGRKAVIVFTDGIDNSSSFASAQKTLALAEESDLLVYALQYDTFSESSEYSRLDNSVGVGKKTTKVYPPGLGPRDYERATAYLRDLTAKSGGRYYHADDLTGIKQAFSLIGEELRSQYTLAYYPRIKGDEKRRHNIEVRVDQPQLVVRARRSYIR